MICMLAICVRKLNKFSKFLYVLFRVLNLTNTWFHFGFHKRQKKGLNNPNPNPISAHIFIWAGYTLLYISANHVGKMH